MTEPPRERAAASEPRERSGAGGPRERACRGEPGGEAPRIRIDINCDLGESFGPWRMGADEQVMAHITSANIACGAHAGDPVVMRNTVRLAKAAGVAVGAHPGFADLQGFGRREMTMDPAEVEASVIAQVGALAAIAKAEGVWLQHVKPHGALYNMAARDRALADAIARAVVSVDASLILFGLPDSPILAAGRAAGLRVAAEGFADRAYQADGTLVPRSQPGAVLEDVEEMVARAVSMGMGVLRTTADGREVPLRFDTICVHGDTAGAAELARRIRAAFTGAGAHVQAIGGWL